MSITIGRVGREITIADPTQVQLQGDTVTFTGLANFTSRADAAWWIDQMAGLPASPDTPAVPIAISSTTEWDGWYEIVSADVSMPPGALGTAASPGYLVFPWQVQARRLTAASNPMMDTYVSWGGPIPNGLTFTDSTVANLWLPPNFYSAQGTSGGALWAVGTYTRTTADGEVMSSWKNGSASTSTTYSVRLSWSGPVTSAMSGAAKIQCDVGSGTWRSVVGRQIRQGLDWRLDNGLMRIYEGSIAGTFRCAWWDGASWETKDYYVDGSSYVGAINNFKAVQVLRNSPETVAIRLWCATTTNTNRVVVVDVSLRRGSRYAELSVSTSDTLNGDGWRLRRTTSEACSTVTNGVTIGLRATSNDAAGNRMAIASDYATTRDTTNGRLTVPSNRVSCRFGIASEVGGSSATGMDVASMLLSEFLNGITEVHRPAAR